MTFFDDLRAEHELIERVVGSLRTFVSWRAAGKPTGDVGGALLAFFLDFAGGFHHAREEGVLVPALIREVELPRERGPIAELFSQHATMEKLLGDAGALWVRQAWTPAEAADAVRLTTEYADLLLRHIDMENSVFFPESEARLARQGVRELESLVPSQAALRAKSAVEALISALPPTENPDLLRGDGCVMCPSMGVTCKGVEREWWTDQEWDDFKEARAAGD